MKLRLRELGTLFLGGCSLVNSPSDFQQGDATTDVAEADGGTDPILFDGGTDGALFDGGMDVVELDVGPDVLGEVGVGDAVVPDVFDAGPPPPPRVVQIEAGAVHTCALINDGRVACWGSNFPGQVGHTTDGVDFVDTDLRFASIDAHENVSCGVTFDQIAYCWGNVMSSIGGGPLEQVSLQPASMVRIGDYRADDTLLEVCILSSGVITCYDHMDLAGTPTVASDLWLGSNPVPVGAIQDFAVGINHMTLLMGDGSVHSIGRDGNGQQGDGELMNGEVLNGPIGHIGASINRSCAADANSVYCWGQAGFPARGGSDVQRNGPVEVMTTSGQIRDIDLNEAQGCAAIGKDLVYCWGITTDLDGNTVGDPLPPQSFQGQGSRLIAAGQRHACNVSAGARVRCWGRNSNGQLGRGRANGVENDLLNALLEL